MRIGIHDSEQETLKHKTFPNYALMKISAYHKANGDTVEWWNALDNDLYDLVYSSKVFDFTPVNPYLPENTIKGGSGYDVKAVLPSEIEEMFPDYSIYPDCDYAIGYITRGCPNRCRWCIVPQKEGDIKPYRTWQELVRQDSKKLVLMDNNILACEYGIEQLESLADSDYRIDLNQGMDARLVTDRVAQILAKVKWIRHIRFSCDSISQIEPILNTANLLYKYGIKPYRLYIYLLVTKDIDNAAYRVDWLKQLKGVTIYAQAERNESLGIIPNKSQLAFTQQYIYSGKYRNETWFEYAKRHNIEYERSGNMGKINFNEKKREKQELESAVQDNEPQELKEAYNGIWGSNKENIEYIELNNIVEFEENGNKQPFSISSEKVEQIKLSAADIGIITPLLVRKHNGKYQIIAGHHRFIAAKELKLLTIPCVVRNISDEDVYKYVAESNIQRMKMLPSEYCAIFNLYLKKHKEIELSVMEVAEKFGVSKKTMYRYINISKLIPKLQELVDTEMINIDVTDIISKFSTENQEVVAKFIESGYGKVNVSLAKKMAEIVEEAEGDEVSVGEFIALTVKPKKAYKNKLYNSFAEKYSVEYSEKELDELVLQFLEEHFDSKVGGQTK